MSEVALWRGAGWQLLAVPHSATRAAARHELRRQLARGVVDGVALPVLAASGVARGAAHVSAAHGQTLSVAAWCDRGAIGVDVVELASLAGMTREEMLDTAGLYLGGAVARQIEQARDPAQARWRFAAAWARHEAGLKCAGEALHEQAATQTLRASHIISILPLGRLGEAARWVVAIARDARAEANALPPMHHDDSGVVRPSMASSASARTGT